MSKELTKEEAEEYYNKLWLENKDLIQENIDRLNKKRFAQALMLAEKDKEIERLHSIIKEVREHIEKTIEYEKSCGFNYWTYDDGQETYIDMVEKTLEILDKENK